MTGDRPCGRPVGVVHLWAGRLVRTHDAHLAAVISPSLSWWLAVGRRRGVARQVRRWRRRHRCPAAADRRRNARSRQVAQLAAKCPKGALSVGSAAVQHGDLGKREFDPGGREVVVQMRYRGGAPDRGHLRYPDSFGCIRSQPNDPGRRPPCRHGRQATRLPASRNLRHRWVAARPMADVAGAAAAGKGAECQTY